MAARVAATSSISSRASSVRKRGNDEGSLLTMGTFGSLEESARSIATRLMGSRDGNLLGNVAGGTAAVCRHRPDDALPGPSRGRDELALQLDNELDEHEGGEFNVLLFRQ